MKKIISVLFLALIILTANPTYAFIPYEITQITDNDYDDLWPRINNNDHFTWVGGATENVFEVYYYNGLIEQLTNNSFRDIGPHINDNGHIAWCGGAIAVDNNVFFYNGYTTTQITHDEYYVGSVSLNNNDDLTCVKRQPLFPSNDNYYCRF